MFSECEYTKNPSLAYAKETFVDFIWKKTHTQKKKKKTTTHEIKTETTPLKLFYFVEVYFSGFVPICLGVVFFFSILGIKEIQNVIVLDTWFIKNKQ